MHGHYIIIKARILPEINEYNHLRITSFTVRKTIYTVTRLMSNFLSILPSEVLKDHLSNKK